MDYPATHPVILSYNKLPCINHFQPPSRPLCQWKPNFKQRFDQIHSVHIVLQFNHVFTSTLRPTLWNPVSSEKSRGFRKFAQVKGMHCQPYPSAWFYPVLRLWNTPSPTLLKPASLHEFTQVLGNVMHFLTPTPAGPAYLLFSLGPSLKNIGVSHPPLGPALPTLCSHIYWCSKLRNETRWAPSKS